MGWVSSIFKPKSAGVAADVLELGGDQRIFGLGRPDDLGFITSAEKALAQPPGRFRDAKALTPAQWRKLMKEGGASKEAFTWQIEPALKALADQGLTADIPKAKFEEAMARNRDTLQKVEESIARPLKPGERLEPIIMQGAEVYSRYVAAGDWTNYSQQLIIKSDLKYTSHNWDAAPGTIGHIRTTDRKLPSGETSRHVEELQSDLHQEGAQVGYRGEHFKDDLGAITFATKARDRARERYLDWRSKQKNRDQIPADPFYQSDLGAPRPDFFLREDLGPEGWELFRTWRDKQFDLEDTESKLSDLPTQPPRAPMENWEEPFVRYALNQAAQQGRDVVTFPTWDTLHRALKNEGTKKFYDERMPATLQRVAKSLGLKVEQVAIDTPNTPFRITSRDQMGRTVWDVHFLEEGAPQMELNGTYASRAEAEAAVKHYGFDKGMGSLVPAIRLTPEAKQQLAKGVVQYALPVAAGGAMLSLMFPDDAEAGVVPKPTWRQFIGAAPKEPPELPGIPAYHGSPHQFDKFEWDAARAGTGEGSQAFGYGLYFAENERTAKAYKSAGFRGPDGKPWRAKFASPNDWAAEVVAEVDGDLAKARERLQYWADFYAKSAKEFRDKGSKQAAERASAALAALESGDYPKVTRPKGHLYETRLKVNPETELLDLDAPFSQQSPRVQEAIRKVWKKAAPEEPARFSPYASQSGGYAPAELNPSITGKEILQLLGNGPEASEFMMAEGIKGVRFYDRLSRKEQAGTRNFVIFDADNVELIKRYGLPAAIAGGVLSLTFPDDAEAQGSATVRAGAEGVRGAMGHPNSDELVPPADFNLPRSIKRGQWIDPGPGVAFRLTPEARTEMETSRAKAETAEGPSLENTIMAALRRESPIVSMLVDQRITDREGRAAIANGQAKAFNPFEAGYLDDYELVADRFLDVMTRREADAMKRQIDREAADMRTLALSGAPGVASQFVAGLLDPTIFLPVAPLKRGESLLKMAFKGAVGGAGSTALSEAWLNSTQELRSSEENVMAVTGGTFFGGILGAGAHAFLKEKPSLPKRLEEELTYKGDADPQFAADRADVQAMGRGRFASAGAAATDKTTIEAEALADVFGLDKVSGAVGLNPIVRLAASESAAAREVSNMLAENGMFLGRNSRGQASPLAVETAMAEYRGWEAKAVTAGRKAYKAHRKAGGSMTRTEFYDAVGKAMRRGDEHPDPSVQAAAAGYREAVEKTKDRAIEMGLLPEDIAPETAASYFHRLWNRKAMTSKPEAFQAMAADWLEETFERMKQRAFGLEADIVAEKGAQDAAKQGRGEASKALTEARNNVKIRERRLEAAKRLEAGASRRSIDAAVEWRQVKSGMKPRPAPKPGEAAQEWDATFDAENVARLQKLEKDQEAFNRAGHRARLRIEQLQEELGWHRPILEKAEKDFEAAKRAHEDVKGEAKLSDEDQKFVDEVKQLMELERVEGSLKGVAANIAKDVYRRLIGYDQRTLPPKITIMERGPLANRTFHIPDLYQGKRPGLEASVEDFLIDDVEAVMSRYMRVMSADIELSRAFGDPTMKKAFDDINADYDELLAQAEEDLVKVAREPIERRKGESDDAYDMRIQKETERVAAAQEKLDKKWADNPEGLAKAIEKAKREIEVRRKKDLKDIAGVRDILRGNYGSPAKHDDLFVRGGAFIRNWNYVTLLGGMTVSAFPDMANKVLSNGFLGIARDLVKPLITDLKGIKIAGAEARNYGVAIEGALNARIASMADIGDAYGRNTPFERSVSNVTNFFSTWTGMRLWNDVMKTADYVMAQNRAIRTLMNDKPSQRDLRWLAWAGVGHRSDLANAMRKEIEAFGHVDRGMRLANPDAWEDQAAARAFKAIMAKEASTVTVTPGAGDKLLAMHGELGKTIAQFKTFTFAAHQRVTLRALQQLRAGDAAYASFFMTAATMGMLVYWLKMSDSLRETSDDPATWVREGIDRSGMLPLLFEVYNTTEKVLQVNDKHWAKPFFPGAAASRYNSRGPIASLLGPTAGRIEDVAGVLAGFGDGNIKDSDVHALRKLLPFQNLVGIRRLLDLLEIQIDKNPAIKRTAFSKGREKALAQ